jgi:hypothetical protein
MNLSRNVFKVTFENGYVRVFNEHEMEAYIIPSGGIYRKDDAKYTFTNKHEDVEFIPYTGIEIIVKIDEQEKRQTEEILMAAKSPFYGETLFWEEYSQIIIGWGVQKILGKWYIYSYHPYFLKSYSGKYKCVVLAISDRPVVEVINSSIDGFWGDQKGPKGYFVKK